MLLKFETESEWLEARARNINSTEIAALFDLSEYKSRLRLWHEKAGNVEPDFSDNQHTRWGRRLQNAVGAGLCEDHGWQGEDLTLFYLQDDKLRLGASMDIKAICRDRGEGLLEVKTTGVFSEELGWYPDKAPIDYEFQIQGQLDLAIREGLPIQWGAIGALDGRKNSRIYERKHDSRLGDLVQEEVAKFWHSVEANEPPPPDYLADAEILEILRPAVREGESVNLSREERAVNLINRYAVIKDRLAEQAEKQKESIDEMTAIKNEILDLIGNAERAIIDEYSISARLQEVDDRLVPGYSFRRFDVKKLKKGR